MLATWTERLFLLLASVVFAVPALAQEGERGGPEAPASDINAMHYLGAAADPAAIMLPVDRPYRVLVFASGLQLPESKLKPGQFAVDGRLYPLGQIDKNDGAETVLARIQGPGIISRIWMERPLGQLRIRIDGAEEAVLNMETEAILKGFIKLFEAPLAGRTGEGGTVLRPIPFTSEVLVTCDQPLGHYMIEARTYDPGLSVDNFNTTSAIGESFLLAPMMSEILAASQNLPEIEVKLNHALILPQADAVLKLKAGESAILLDREVKTPSKLDWIELEMLSPFTRDDLPSSLSLVVEVDGVETMRLPLPHVFGSSRFAEGSSLHLKAREVLAGRVRRLRFSLPQPFSRSLRLKVLNLGYFPSVDLRFRTQVTEADSRVGTRRLQARVLNKASPLLKFDSDAVVVAESLIADPTAPEFRSSLVQFGKEGEFETPLAACLGIANAGTWSDTFSYGVREKRRVWAFRSRLFDRLSFRKAECLRLVNVSPRLSYAIFFYSDATKGE